MRSPTTDEIKRFSKIVRGIYMFKSLYLTLICFTAVAVSVANAITDINTDVDSIEFMTMDNKVTVGEIVNETTTVKEIGRNFSKETEAKFGVDRIKFKLTLVDIILVVIIVVIIIFIILLNKKVSKVKTEIDEILSNKVNEVKAEINENLKDVLKQLNGELESLKELNEFKNNFAGRIAECQKIKDLDKSIREVKEELDRISNQSYNPVHNLDSRPFQEQIQTQDQIQNSVSAVLQLQSEKPRFFWVGSPQNGIFRESDYEFYKCETIPGDKEGRVYFSFNEAPNVRRRFFENESERINNLAETAEGFADVNSSITNLKSPNGKPYGILKRNPNGEGWVLEKKAKIKFSGG